MLPRYELVFELMIAPIRAHPLPRFRQTNHLLDFYCQDATIRSFVARSQLPMMIDTNVGNEDDERDQSDDWLSKIPIFGRKPKRSGKRGRPQVRSDTDVQVVFRMPAQDYANLVGYIEMLRERARTEGLTEGRFSRQAILMGLWKKHWEDLEYAVKRLSQSNRPYRDALKRAESGDHSTDL